MRQFFISILIFISYLSVAQVPPFFLANTLTTNLRTNDFVYSNSADKIYALISADNSTDQNSIAILNPYTISVESSIQFTHEPSVIAISQDEQYVYIGFKNLAKIKRYSVTSNTIDMEFDLNYYDFGLVPCYPRKIEVSPGNNNVVAITRRDHNGNSKGAGLYISGILQPLDGEDLITDVRFINQNTLYGYCTNCVSTYLRKFDVSDNGITQVASYENMPGILWLGLDSLHFVYHNNKFYFNHGRVVNLLPAPHIEEQYLSNINYGGITYDPHTNLICSADSYLNDPYVDGNGMYQMWKTKVRRYNPDTNILYDSFYIKLQDWDINKFIMCGEGCYALTTSVYNVGTASYLKKFSIVRDAVLNSKNTTSRAEIKLYPNPTSDFIQVNTSSVIKDALVYDSNGRTILCRLIDNKIDISNTANGIYLIKLTDENNNVYTQKIIKQ